MKIFLQISLIFGCIFCLISCKKLVSGINTDPNNPTYIPPEQLLIGGEVGLVYEMESQLARNAAYLDRSARGLANQQQAFWSYNFQGNFFDGDWSGIYAQIIPALALAESEALSGQNKVLAGIAEVNLAFLFGTTADLWGDIPLSQADNKAVYPYPMYDKQLNAYDSVQSLLNKAINNLSTNSGTASGADIFNGGNVAAWIQIAYTVKARFYLHVARTNVAYYDSALANADKGISSISNDWIAPQGTTFGGDNNAWQQFMIVRNGDLDADSAYTYSLQLFFNRLSWNSLIPGVTNDSARLMYLYTLANNVKAQADNFVPNDANPQAIGSSIPTGFFGGNWPLVTYAENQLIIAEANWKKNNYNQATVALNNYRNQLNVGYPIYIGSGYRSNTNAQYGSFAYPDSFGVGNSGNRLGLNTPQAALLQNILEERYITFVGQIEGFNDVRRTNNFLKIPIAPYPINSTNPNKYGTLPQRFLYSQIEQAANPNSPRQSSTDIFKPTTVNDPATPY
ncbi:MAG: SusD/RagB family nutrient-binding outer membrane lipoprotein [Phycisphaerales bacterium]|nr:SusD/RagB family nutrient-binding outer membrane lipoprotein [Phycisphaerales bacterium]